MWVMGEVVGLKSSRINAHFNCLEFVMENDEDLCDFVAGVVNLHQDGFTFATLTEEEFRCHNLIFTIKRSLDYHLKLYEMGRRVKMLVLKCDSPTIDSGAIPEPLLHKMSTSMSQSARSAAMPCPSPQQLYPPHTVHVAEIGISLNK